MTRTGTGSQIRVVQEVPSLPPGKNLYLEFCQFFTRFGDAIGAR